MKKIVPVAIIIIAIFVSMAGCTEKEIYGMPDVISSANTEKNPISVAFDVGQTNNISYDITFDDIKIGSYISSEHGPLEIYSLQPFAGTRVLKLTYDQLPNKTVGRHKLKFVNSDGIVENTKLIDII